MLYSRNVQGEALDARRKGNGICVSPIVALVVECLLAKVLSLAKYHQFLLAAVLRVLGYSNITTADDEELVAPLALTNDSRTGWEKFL